MMQARSVDTDPDAEAVQLELLRKAGPARRARMALDLSAQVIGMSKRAIQRTMPGATALEVNLRFAELNYGYEIAAQVRAHLARRR
jgi:hypothetical protein